MLRFLTVKDFAIIDHAELAFGPGMTVLSGETGAGKSLIVDALLLLSGARADAGFIRAGAERAELAAEFDLAHVPAARRRLAELELDAGEECRIRRVLRADGTSRCFVNDTPVTLQTLKGIAEDLIEIHGQHEHQALLARARQLDLLDNYGNHVQQRARVASAARDWQDVAREIAALRERTRTGPELLELVRFQLDELERHVLPADALQSLEDEHRRLAHHGDLVSGCARTLEALDGDHDAALRPLLVRAVDDLERLVALDPKLADVGTLLREAAVQVDEAVSALERYQSAQDLDPDRLAEVDAKLGRLHDLARKHRVPVHDLPARTDQLRHEYDEMAGADTKLAALTERQAALRGAYRDLAAELSAMRATAAKRLGKAVSTLMGELGMAGGRFAAELSSDADAEPRAAGIDEVEFMVAANPGQPARPLRKVASGGELSRIGLALEVAALGKDEIATMVFDEVDAGIGGAVAEVVGRKLKSLGSARQVLCVTHLPQVAAQADHHVAVSKDVEGKATKTRIATLDGGARVEEISRMLGGVEISPETRAHAEAMLRQAGNR